MSVIDCNSLNLNYISQVLLKTCYNKINCIIKNILFYFSAFPRLNENYVDYLVRTQDIGIENIFITIPNYYKIY